MENTETKKLHHISRENLSALLDEANEREISQEDIVDVVVKGNMFYLIYVA